MDWIQSEYLPGDDSSYLAQFNTLLSGMSLTTVSQEQFYALLEEDIFVNLGVGSLPEALPSQTFLLDKPLLGIKPPRSKQIFQITSEVKAVFPSEWEKAEKLPQLEHRLTVSKESHHEPDVLVADSAPTLDTYNWSPFGGLWLGSSCKLSVSFERRDDGLLSLGKVTVSTQLWDDSHLHVVPASTRVHARQVMLRFERLLVICSGKWRPSTQKELLGLIYVGSPEAFTRSNYLLTTAPNLKTLNMLKILRSKQKNKNESYSSPQNMSGGSLLSEINHLQWEGSDAVGSPVLSLHTSSSAKMEDEKEVHEEPGLAKKRYRRSPDSTSN